MKLSPPQKIISDDPARFRVACCGRRFGKSFLAMNEAGKFARFPGQIIMYVAPTYRQAREIFFNPMRELLKDLRWLRRANESQLDLHLVNGSVIRCRSSDNHDSLRGGKVNFLIMDEVQDIKHDAYTTVRPMLSDTGGHGLFIGTPKGMGSWFYDLWSDAKITDDWSAYQFTTLDGGNVPPEEIESARRDMDSRTFEQEYEAAFVNYAGVIFYNYSDELHLKPYDWSQFTDRTPLFLSIDFNVSPITCGVAVKHATGFHYVDEIEIYGSNTMELVQEIRNRYGNRQYYGYPDATGSRKNTNSQGVSDHIILQNNGIKILCGATNPNVNDSIASVNALLLNNAGEINLTFDPKCRKIRECMLKYTYREGTRIPDKDNIYDHFADGIRYLCHGVFPIKQESVLGAGKRYRTL